MMNKDVRNVTDDVKALESGVRFKIACILSLWSNATQLDSTSS